MLAQKCQILRRKQYQNIEFEQYCNIEQLENGIREELEATQIK